MIVDALEEALFPAAASPPPDDDKWYTDLSWSPLLAASGTSPDHALQVSAVYACVRVLAETLAHLPLHVMRREGRSRVKATEHNLYDVLHYQPNDWQTSFEFREMMQGHAGLRGNAYAQIKPGPRGAVDQLIPLHPDRMDVFRLENNRLGYLFRDKQGEEFRLTQDEVLHIRGYSTDGMVGISPIAVGRNAIELAEAAEDHGIKFFKNMAKPGGVLKMPEGQTLTPERHALLKKSWREAHSAADLFTVGILENGMDWQQLGLSNEDGQWLDSRKYQVVDICRIFRVPPHMVASGIDPGGNTYANVENSDLSFVKHTMLPWLVRWEHAIRRDLIVDQARYYAKFALEGLLRADTKTRGEFYRTLWMIGAITDNEIREWEDLNPVAGGDTHFVPLNMAPLGTGNALAAQDRLALITEPAAELPSPPAAAVELPSPAADAAAFRGWLADAAERIASAEIRELEKRAGKAAEDRDRFDAWVRHFWGGKQREYIEKTLAPISVARYSTTINAEDVAADVCDRTIAELTTSDPVGVLGAWKENRTNSLTQILTEAICSHENE